MTASVFRRSVCKLSVFLFVAFLEVALGQATAGGGIVSLVSQQRYVDVNTTGVAQLTNPPHVIPLVDQRKAASGNFAAGAPFNEPIELEGFLQPGTYAFQVTAPGNGADFDLNLQVGTAVVPLPPVCWAALSAIPALLLGKRLLTSSRSFI